MKNNKGFTILEMMIVLSIIALVFLLTLGYLKDTQRRCPNGDTIEISNGQAAVR